MLGTPAYMSPEQFRGEPVDARTDLYSAGVVLYQSLTGDKPFEGNLTAIMHKVLNVEPPRPSEIAGSVPPVFDAVVRKAMAKRPAERFQTAAAFREAIAEAMHEAEASDPLLGLLGGADTEVTVVASAPSDRPAVSIPVRSGTQPPVTKKGLPFGLVAGGAGAVVAAGVAAFLLFGRGTDAPTPEPAAPQATAQATLPAATTPSPPPPVALATPPPVTPAAPGPVASSRSPSPAEPVPAWPPGGEGAVGARGGATVAARPCPVIMLEGGTASGAAAGLGGAPAAGAVKGSRCSGTGGGGASGAGLDGPGRSRSLSSGIVFRTTGGGAKASETAGR